MLVHAAAVRAERAAVPAKFLQHQVGVGLGTEPIGELKDVQRHRENGIRP